MAKRKIEEVEIFEFYAGVALKDVKLIPASTVDDRGEMSFQSFEESHRIQC